MKIVVTQRVDHISSYNETREGMDQRVSQWLVLAGFLPVPICNSLVITHDGKNERGTNQPILEEWLAAVQPDGFLITGGNSIGNCPERDATEYNLLSWAQTNRKPVLGICRGMQLMATWIGGDLVEVEGHVRTRHRLKFEQSGSGWPCEVNSFHDWGLVVCPSEYQVMARTDDDVIEAIRHKELPWEGWMWHPERETPFSNTDSGRLKALFAG